MTTPFIPAIDPEVSKSLVNFIQLAGRTLKPFAETEHALANAFSANPEMLQKYADFAANNPEAVKNLLGPRVASYLKTVPESPASRLARTQAAYNQGIVNSRNEGLQGMSETERGNAGRVGASTDLAGMRPSEVNTEVNTTARQDSYSAWRAANPRMGALDFVQKFRSNARDGDNPVVSEEAFAGALNGPDRDVIRMLWDQEVAKDEAALRERLANANDAAQRNLLIESSQRDEAARAWEKSGYRGSIEDWRQYMTNPAKRRRAQELAAIAEGTPEYQNLTPEEQGLRQVGIGANDAQRGVRSRIEAPARKNIQVYLNEATRLATALRTKKLPREDYDAQIVNIAELINNSFDLLQNGMTAEVATIDENWLSADRPGIIIRKADGTPASAGDLAKVQAGVTDSTPAARPTSGSGTGRTPIKLAPRQQAQANEAIALIRANRPSQDAIDRTLAGLAPNVAQVVRDSLAATPSRP